MKTEKYLVPFALIFLIAGCGGQKKEAPPPAPVEAPAPKTLPPLEQNFLFKTNAPEAPSVDTSYREDPSQPAFVTEEKPDETPAAV